MNSPKVSFESYVGIATCMVDQDSDCERLQQSVSDWAESTGTLESASDGAETDSEINTPDLLELEWSKRIEEWQKLYPDKGPPVEECTSLKDIQFCTFFLQYPIAGMALWNVIQAFYALDRFVCCTSKELWDKIAGWESMPPFEYLVSSRVEKRWRISLRDLKKEIKEVNHGDNRDVLSPRMIGMHLGTVKLEEAWRELERILKANMKDTKLADSMLEQIHVAYKWRFKMIDTYLKVDDNHNGETSVEDSIHGVTGSGMIDSMSGLKKLNARQSEEPMIFKPLSRSNSMEIVKHHLIVAWVSTKRGEVTLTALLILLILLILLYQLRECLVIIQEH